MIDFVKFPHTPHLAWLGSAFPRDDKVLSPEEVKDFLADEVVLEEKIDGANLGLSVDASGRIRAQNRSHYLEEPFGGQFGRLREWVAMHEDVLFDSLGENLVAFGEWCAAKHSVEYSSLPDWWVVFDIYDCRHGRFWSTVRRNAWALRAGFPAVAEIERGKFDLTDICRLLDISSSSYRVGSPEGFVVRQEDMQWLNRRAKIVRADFTQQIATHWRKRSIVWNRLANGRP